MILTYKFIHPLNLLSPSRQLQFLFESRILKPSLKTYSGCRTRKISGFFVPKFQVYQAWSESIKTFELHNSASLTALSRLFNGVVDTAEYKTRKGNKPGRLYAESETTSPKLALDDTSLKHIGINTMLDINCYQVATTNPSDNSEDHEFIFAHDLKRAKSKLGEHSKIVFCLPVQHTIKLSKPETNRSTQQKLLSEMGTYSKQYWNIREKQRALDTRTKSGRYELDCLEVEKIYVVDEMMKIVSANLELIQDQEEHELIKTQLQSLVGISSSSGKEARK